MKKINILIILLATLTVVSCTIPRKIKNAFTYCYDGNYTGLDTLININGYYRSMAIREQFEPMKRDFMSYIFSDYESQLFPVYDVPMRPTDTGYTYFMFYDNGIFKYNIPSTQFSPKPSYTSIGIIRHPLVKTVDYWLNYFAENSNPPENPEFYNNYWGSYRMCGDTIKMQYMRRGYVQDRLYDPWLLSEGWYKIIDKSTLLCIDFFNLPLNETTQPLTKPTYPIQFFPITKKPKSEHSWIIKEKWFWCDEDAWKSYMDSTQNKDNIRR